MKKFLTLAVSLTSLLTHSQDIILKINGDSILAKVVEVGTNAISYKKFNYQDGPLFVENKTEIRLIRFSNGDVQVYDQNAYTPAQRDSARADSLARAASNTQSSSTSTTTPQPQPSKVRIARYEKGYTINNQSASQKEVDRQLGTSKNPAIIIPLKAAKTMKTAQKIVKIASYPTTIGGGIATLVTGINLWNDVQRGRATSKSYKDAILSLFTSVSLPITNKIMKNKSDKMYDKLIDLYNVTN